MKIDEFLKEYGEFEHLFDIVSEPEYSKKILLEYQEKYKSSGVNSQLVYWYYKTQGFEQVKSSIPEVEDWVYYYECFLESGGNPFDLEINEDSSKGQVSSLKEEKSGSNEPLFLFYNKNKTVTQYLLFNVRN